MTTTLAMTAASSAITKLVEKLIIPKIVNFADNFYSDMKESLIERVEHFTEYLNRTYENYNTVNTLVFHNSQRQLKDIYVAQTLVKSDYYESEKEKTVIDGLPVRMINKYKKVLITDTAGMGKSTIMKRMYIDLIDRGLDGIGIPIYIELNRLNKDQTILKEIHEELNSLSKEFNKDMLMKFIQTGGFVFFMDGYDEISIADRSEVIQDIQKFISKAGTNNFYILTSRPEDNLTSFGDFQLFNIQPLKKEEAFNLLIKYDVSPKKTVSKKLIKLLQSGEYEVINEYLTNPLLVSLLFTAYDYNRAIPLEKHRFYGKVFDAFFEEHDNSKPIKPREKRSGLNYDGFNRILRYIGYDSLIHLGVTFSEETILKSIRNAKDFYGDQSFSEHDFLDDLIIHVPLFCHDGTGYRWVHKSLLEYFAAQFIYCDSKKDQDDILTLIYESKNFEKYTNMLDIYYYIDPKGFSKNIILPFCEGYVKFYDENYKELNVNKGFIEDRIAYLYMCDVAFILSTQKLKQDNEFRVVKQNWDKDCDFRFNRTLAFEGKDIYCYTSFKFKPNPSLLNFLLNNVNESLFSNLFDLFMSPKRYRIMRYSQDGYNVALNKLHKIIELNKVYVADVETGDGDDFTYEIFNLLFMNLHHKWYPNYSACKKEADRIRKELELSNNDSYLKAGI